MVRPPDPLFLSPQAHTEEVKTVDRPVWQSFVLCLQLHFPEMGEDIKPALSLGKAGNHKTLLSAEAIGFLNLMMCTWYQALVELRLTELAPPGLAPAHARHGVVTEKPYYPVTGLNLVITTSTHWTSRDRDRHILHARERWKVDPLWTNLQTATRLLVQERVPTTSPKGRWLKFMSR
jgi:hypothetical protein